MVAFGLGTVPAWWRSASPARQRDTAGSAPQAAVAPAVMLLNAALLAVLGLRGIV